MTSEKGFLEKLLKKDLYVLLFLLVLAFVFRLFTLFPSVIDHDESTYIIIASQLLDGKWPFVNSIEIKPVGIYLIFAAALKAFGHSVMAIRIVANIFVALTGYILYKTKKRVSSAKTGLLVAITYIVLASIHKWTWSANTELFFNLFIALGVFMIYKARNYWHYLLLGVFMGIGFIVKYLVLLDFLALGVFYLISNFNKIQRSRYFVNAFLALVGFALPFLITGLVYYAFGHWDSFYFATIVLPGNYPASFNLSASLGFMGEIYASYIPFSIIYFYSLYQIIKNKSSTAYTTLAVIWPVFAWMAILSAGKISHHYAFQALIPMCFFMYDFIQYRKKAFGLTPKPQKWVFIGVFVLFLLAGQYMQIKKLILKPDIPEQIAAYLKPKLNKEDKVFILHQNILYFLLDKDPPHKYVHTTLLTDTDLINAFEVDAQKVKKCVFDQQPKYVVVFSHWTNHLSGYLDNYRLVKTFQNEKVELYKISN